MAKTKDNDNCITGMKTHRSSGMVLISLTLTIMSLICGARSSTLPVKTFPVFSPQTIAQLSHSKSPAALLSGNSNNANSAINPGPINSQKESDVIGSLQMPLQYSYDDPTAVFDAGDPETVQFDNDDETTQLQELAKRAPNKWQGLQGGWGKRAPNNWNKLSAAWGKRRIPNNAAWNNLSGMWGKKRAKWNELSGMWGKRAAWRDMSGGWGKKKRSNAPHWNKLRGMWGKRSVGEAENHAFTSEEQTTMVQQQSQEQPNIAVGNLEQYPQSSSFPSSIMMMNSDKKDH